MFLLYQPAATNFEIFGKFFIGKNKLAKTLPSVIYAAQKSALISVTAGRVHYKMLVNAL